VIKVNSTYPLLTLSPLPRAEETEHQVVDGQHDARHWRRAQQRKSDPAKKGVCPPLGIAGARGGERREARLGVGALRRGGGGVSGV